jgi:hypothetical protein
MSVLDWLQQQLGGGPPGRLEPGNIDLNKRPVVRNPDGSISTVRSMGVNFDGREMLIPTVSPEGQLLDNDAAIELYRRTGQHLGAFDTPANSNAYAERLHEDQARQYDQGAPMAVQNPRTGAFDPYQPPPPPDAMQLLSDMTGATDLGQAYNAYQRGEYLPALGQGAWGAAQMAGTAIPALKVGGAALKAGVPLAREAAAAIPGLLADETGAIRAYHGSPHSFDKFDLSKIGTGEGAQAYGHGLYFAEAEPVARSYRDALAPLSYKGPSADDDYRLSTPLAAIMRRLGETDETPEQAVAAVKSIMGETAGRLERDLAVPGGVSPSARSMNEMALENYRASLGVYDKINPADFSRPGHMYEVDIHADPKAFLDWDRPLAGQPEAMRQTLVPQVQRAIDTEMTTGSDPLRFTGGEAYGAVRGITPDYARGGSGMADVSAMLREAGIPGIRYLDQGSRGAGEGSSNYAIFDPKIIEILRKYGILPPAVAAGGLLTTGSEPPT